MSAAAGWYADPSGAQGTLRWWDGERWTDHTTPDPNASTAATAPVDTSASEASAEAASGTTTTVTDTRADAGWGAEASADASGQSHGGWVAGDTSHRDPTPATDEPSQPPPPTGRPLDQPAATHAQQPANAWGTYQGPPSWQTDVPPATSSSTVRTGLIVAAIVGVAVLAIVAALVFGLITIRDGGGFEEDFFDGGTFDEVPAETIDGGEIAPGGSVNATIPEGGMFETTLVVERGGPVVIDVRATNDFDGVLQLLDANGSTIAENDDREAFDDQRYLDPLIEEQLEPGRYTIQVRGWSGEGGNFELSVS